MREIKYRAFIEHLKMIAPVSRINFDVRTIEVDLSDGNGDYFEYDFDEVDLMQWTGLKDKNDVKIYEGDIVNCNFENRGTGVISFSLNNQQTMIYKNFNCDIPVCDLDYSTARFCEIISNIYENQHLFSN